METKRFDSKYDRSIREIVDLQNELTERTIVEQKAEELICQCRFTEAIQLLASLSPHK